MPFSSRCRCNAVNGPLAFAKQGNIVAGGDRLNDRVPDRRESKTMSSGGLPVMLN